MNAYTRSFVDLMRVTMGPRAPRLPFHTKELWDTIYGRCKATFEWAELQGGEFLTHKYCRPNEKFLVERVQGRLREGSLEDFHASEEAPRVLDIGCGLSELCVKLRDAGVSQNIVGVDFSSKAIEWCEEHLRRPGVQYRVADARHLPADLGSFDVVLDKGTVDANWCSGTSQAEISSIARAVHHVLKPGGVFLSLSFTSPDYLEPYLRDIAEAEAEVVEQASAESQGLEHSASTLGDEEGPRKGGHRRGKRPRRKPRGAASAASPPQRPQAQWADFEVRSLSNCYLYALRKVR